MQTSEGDGGQGGDSRLGVGHEGCHAPGNEGGKATGLGRPVALAVGDDQLISPGLEDQLGHMLGSGNQPVAVDLQVIGHRQTFFSPAGQGRFDGLLTNAESGAAWAVLHLHSSLITPFDKGLSGELLLMMASNNTYLRRYVNGWLSQAIARGGFQRLFDHWILQKS
jgi:hypothetical protein